MAIAFWLSIQISLGFSGLADLPKVVENQPLSKVLDAWVTEDEMPLAFVGEAPDLPVNIAWHGEPVEEILEALSQQVLLTWQAVGSHYVLTFDPRGRGTLRGTIQLSEYGDPLAGGIVSFIALTASGNRATSVINAEGEFLSPALLPGTYRLELEVAGFQKILLGNMVLAPFERKVESFRVAMIAVDPGEMIVTPAHYQLLGEEPQLSHFRSRNEASRMPHLGNDMLRHLGYATRCKPRWYFGQTEITRCLGRGGTNPTRWHDSARSLSRQRARWRSELH